MVRSSEALRAKHDELEIIVGECLNTQKQAELLYKWGRVVPPEHKGGLIPEIDEADMKVTNRNRKKREASANKGHDNAKSPECFLC